MQICHINSLVFVFAIATSLLGLTHTLSSKSSLYPHDDGLGEFGFNVSILNMKELEELRFGKLLDIIPLHSPNPWHSCYSVSCKDPNSPICENTQYMHICAPAMAVAGFPKCGTSAITNFVTHVPGVYRYPLGDVATICPHKECDKDTTKLEDMFQTFTLPLNAIAGKGTSGTHFLWNGDIQTKRHMIMNSVLGNTKTSYVMMIRDYADMVWSRYNYFCFNVLDGDCDEIDMSKRHRSPEHFHQLIISRAHVTSSARISHGAISHGAQFGCDVGTDDFYYTHANRNIAGINDMIAAVGEDRVILVADQQLEEDPHAVYKKLAQKSDYFKLHYNMSYIEGFKKVRVNLNDVHASAHQEAGDTTLGTSVSDVPPPGTYSISGHKPMLPETRAYLDRCWRKECELISEIIGFQFPSCRKSNLPNPSNPSNPAKDSNPSKDSKQPKDSKKPKDSKQSTLSKLFTTKGSKKKTPKTPETRD